MATASGAPRPTPFLAILPGFLAALGACSPSSGGPHAPPGDGTGTVVAPTADPTAAPTSSASAPPVPTTFSTAVIATVKQGHVYGELREGNSCAGIGPQIPPDGILTVDGTYAVQKFSTGCGCPTGPHYTMLYHPGTAPLEVRLCKGPGTDPCKALCFGTLPYELTEPLKKAKTDQVKFVPVP